MESDSAMPQPTNAAIYHGDVARFLRWPYQAKVMKTLLASSNKTACSEMGRDCRAVMAKARRPARRKGECRAADYEQNPPLRLTDKRKQLLKT